MFAFFDTLALHRNVYGNGTREKNQTFKKKIKGMVLSILHNLPLEKNLVYRDGLML